VNNLFWTGLEIGVESKLIRIRLIFKRLANKARIFLEIFCMNVEGGLAKSTK